MLWQNERVHESQQARMSVEWKESFEPCPVCGSSRHSRLGRRGGDAHRARLGKATNVVRCHECHLVYCLPRLEPLTNPYAGETANGYFDAHDSAEKLNRGRGLIEIAQSHLGRKGPGRLLELGCGRGELLGAAAERGWSAYGVEMTPEFAAVARSRGVHVEMASVETSQTLEGEAEFDVVYLAAILEHLYDPVACLKRVRRALAPGGVVFIDVPNECSIRTRIGNGYMRLRGRDWAVNLAPTFPPFHVVGFCPTSLRRAVQAADLRVAGLRVVRWRDLLPSHAGLWGRLESLGSAGVNALAGLMGDGDGIICWARRPSAD